MASNNEVNLSTLNLIDLDYYNNKTSLKNFLKAQPQFKDYDYDGPNMAALLRLLSYNTYLNSFYTNMAISEAHLDSAQLRSSIVSHAKSLNYVPRSVRSAKATVKVDFEATGASQPYTLQKGQLFSAIVKNSSYVFSLPETITVSSANNTFSFESDIYEGFYVKDSFVFKDSIENQRFKLSNPNVDTRSIAVTVYEDGAQVGDIYVSKSTLLDLNSKSKVFFLQATEDGYYEIIFGDNVLGRQPKINSTVVIDYRLSSGSEANGAKLFSIDFDPTGSDELNSTPIVTTLESSKNGEEREPDESIRYYAPRSFQVQERTVVDTDYEVALKTQFPEINVISSYGGAEANPPRMGKVIIAVDISLVDGLPESKKQEYERFIKARSSFGIHPIFVEPDYLYVDINSTVRYNLNVTTNSPTRIKTLVTNAITTYNEIYLNDFKSTLRYSALTRAIDFADASIVSNITEIQMYKKIKIVLGAPTNYTIDFELPLQEDVSDHSTQSHKTNSTHAVKSSDFTTNGTKVFLEDDGRGNVMMNTREGLNDISIKKVGSVNYDTGKIILTNLKVDTFDGANFRMFAFPRDKDITTDKNSILLIEPSGINLKIEELRI